MFDIGWSEMMVIGVVALIVVGPKDLPKMFHTAGQAMGKARAMAREFQRAMDAAGREAGVNDLRKAASGQAFKEAAGLDDIEKEFRDIGHDRPATRPAMTPPPMPPAKPAAAAGTATGAATPASAAAEGDLERRNAEFSHTEALRQKRADEAAAARVQAAEARARREAAEAAARAPESRPDPAEPQPWRPAPPQNPES